MTEWQRNRMQHTTGIRPVRDSRHSAQTFTNCTTACMYCWRYTRLIAEPFTCILMLYIYMLYYLIRSWPAACICTLFHKPEFWSVQSTNAMCINNIQVLLCSMELKRHEVEPCTAFEVGHKCLHFYTYMQWFRCVESTLCAFISINTYAPTRTWRDIHAVRERVSHISYQRLQGDTWNALTMLYVFTIYYLCMGLLYYICLR